MCDFLGLPHQADGRVLLVGDNSNFKVFKIHQGNSIESLLELLAEIESLPEIETLNIIFMFYYSGPKDSHN
jgi:hypothetical protein